MINIWYHDHIKKGIVRGPRKVIENFHRSLDDCGVKYSVNEEKYARNIFLHWGKEWFEKYNSLKHKENLLIGPHVWPFGDDLNHLGEYKSLIFPSKWCVDSCVNNFPHLRGSYWPVAIYKPEIVEDPKFDCLVYYKDRPERDLLDVISFLESRGITYTGLQYGNYTPKEFNESLSQVKYCIIIDNTESQGIAIQEMMACNKPLYVWDTKIWTYVPSYPAPATSVPYWSDECGMKVYNFKKFQENFDEFISNLDDYCPADYIKANLSPQKSIEILMSNYV
jgi:hypothetical protein